MHVLFVKDEDVIEALASQAAEEALTDGVDQRGTTAVRMTRVPAPLATRSNSVPNLLSRSRMMNCGPSPKAQLFREGST
jgi:hypothetical protein